MGGYSNKVFWLDRGHDFQCAPQQLCDDQVPVEMGSLLPARASQNGLPLDFRGSMDPVLKVQELTVCYRDGVGSPIAAVNDASFELAAGETVGILGESGCGKTSLALAVLGLLPQGAFIRRGAVLFRGTNLLALSERALQKIRGAEIALIHQDPSLALSPFLRVGEQITEILIAHRRISSRQAREESKEILAQVGFNPDGNIHQAYPHQLSGGQKQRVAIAQAMACGPGLVIADEPVASLDAVLQFEFINLLQSLQKRLNLALMLITHTPAILVSIAHRILVMYAGRIIEQGPAREILEAPLHPYTQGLLKCELDLLPQDAGSWPLASIPGEPPNPKALPMGCAFAPRCSDRMEVCEARAPAESHPEKSRDVWCFKYD